LIAALAGLRVNMRVKKSLEGRCAARQLNLLRVNARREFNGPPHSMWRLDSIG
jgi:hypothetical protein